MKLLLVLLAMCLGLGATACGSANMKHKLPPRAGSSPASPSNTASAAAHRYLNDGDAEKKNDYDNDNKSADHEDTDGDSTNEYEETFENRNYHDRDDAVVLSYGRAAGRGERNAIANVVDRYYAAAAAGNGMEACAMMAPVFARSVPEDYGGSAGPAYLRGSGTCQAALSRLFAHLHTELSGAVKVTGVRLKGNTAVALVGSDTIAAGTIGLQRGGRDWKINALLGGALP